MAVRACGPDRAGAVLGAPAAIGADEMLAAVVAPDRSRPGAAALTESGSPLRDRTGHHSTRIARNVENGDGPDPRRMHSVGKPGPNSIVTMWSSPNECASTSSPGIRYSRPSLQPTAHTATDSPGASTRLPRASTVALGTTTRTES